MCDVDTIEASLNQRNTLISLRMLSRQCIIFDLMQGALASTWLPVNINIVISGIAFLDDEVGYFLGATDITVIIVIVIVW